MNKKVFNRIIVPIDNISIDELNDYFKVNIGKWLAEHDNIDFMESWYQFIERYWGQLDKRVHLMAENKCDYKAIIKNLDLIKNAYYLYDRDVWITAFLSMKHNGSLQVENNNNEGGLDLWPFEDGTDFCGELKKAINKSNTNENKEYNYILKSDWFNNKAYIESLSQDYKEDLSLWEKFLLIFSSDRADCTTWGWRRIFSVESRMRKMTLENLIVFHKLVNPKFVRNIVRNIFIYDLNKINDAELMRMKNILEIDSFSWLYFYQNLYYRPNGPIIREKINDRVKNNDDKSDDVLESSDATQWFGAKYESINKTHHMFVKMLMLFIFHYGVDLDKVEETARECVYEIFEHAEIDIDTVNETINKFNYINAAEYYNWRKEKILDSIPCDCDIYPLLVDLITRDLEKYINKKTIDEKESKSGREKSKCFNTSKHRVKVAKHNDSSKDTEYAFWQTIIIHLINQYSDKNSTK